MYEEITGEEPEPSAAVKQTDDIFNNRHSDLTDEELINAIYDERGKSGTSTYSHYFRGSDDELQRNILDKRFPRERLKALALNTNTEFNVASLSP